MKPRGSGRAGHAAPGRGRSPQARRSGWSVDWRGPLGRAGGLGGASRSYVRALRGAGLPVNASAAMGQPAAGRLAPGTRRMLVYHYPPHTLDPDRARRAGYGRVVLNAVWETSRIPSQWRRTINRYDAVLVPSRHNVQAMKDSGVSVPVYRVPHGVDTRRFRPGRPKAALSGAEGRFVFLSVFSFQHRKNPEALLRAYAEEFSEKDSVLLVIKTSGWREAGGSAGAERAIRRYVASLRLSHRPAPIHIVAGHIGERRLLGLYASADAFVLPTRGEGVGMPFMEALASGVPVIAPRWGGQSDFLTDGNSFAVPYKLRKPAESMKGAGAISRRFGGLFAQEGQLWAEADLAGLKRQLRAASRDVALCRRKGRQGCQDMKSWSWEAAGRQLRQALERIGTQPPRGGAAASRESGEADPPGFVSAALRGQRRRAPRGSGSAPADAKERRTRRK
ncbi:glycosyltransferase family 4 protein [Paenibacillus sp. FSL W8-1187]|nr:MULTISPECIES: glycosyltransferase family 4 protein [Paenibacillus]QGG58301.1 glycosyltransferase [Paenibacillus sp. B01]